MEKRTKFDIVEHEVDLCIVGGGLAGLCAAVAAARHGAKVMLMQDRPVLGGNASSEIRMWVLGARGVDNRETGILEEIFLDNYFHNEGLKYPIWDHVLYSKAISQPGLELLLNTTCNSLEMDGSRIASVRGWQLTTQTWHVVRAKYFADCSGDSVLRISGAEYRWGREARSEFNESIAPLTADRQTMGNSILLQLREVDTHVPFVPPAWAYKLTEADLPHRPLKPEGNNFWWIEIGGVGNTIADTEIRRDELLKYAYGIWDLIKNHPDGRGHRWELEWIGSLPGKRENVRYVGDHILTQNDIEAEGKFDDMVAYGGWTMDDHPPAAIRHSGEPTIFHPAPSPYGIPYRSLYSRNIENLFFAGRNISTTHMALSSTRVMSTCSILGQAMGTAAALAVRYACSPRQIYESHIRELQETLLDDDCYLPWHTRPIPEIALKAQLSASTGDPAPLRSGIDRSLNQADHGWWGSPGVDWVEYRFSVPQKLSLARFTFDSNLREVKKMPCNYPSKGNHVRIPPMMTRDFDLEALDSGGKWQVIQQVRGSYQRLVRIPLNIETTAVRFVPKASWGGDRVHVFGFDVR
ncbi:MAG TPA: FAD-dependent oxidoreductase [Anaerolineaceae bacterium]